MPAGLPDWPGCQRCGLPGLNWVGGLPDCPGLNLVFFAMGVDLGGFRWLGYGDGSRSIPFGWVRGMGRAGRRVNLLN